MYSPDAVLVLFKAAALVLNVGPSSSTNIRQFFVSFLTHLVRVNGSVDVSGASDSDEAAIVE